MGRRYSLPHHNKRLDRLTKAMVRNSDQDRLHNARKGVQSFFDLRWAYAPFATNNVIFFLALGSCQAFFFDQNEITVE
jgi:hypothetical protein